MTALVVMVSLAALLIAASYLILNYYPPLGSKDKGPSVYGSPHYAEGKFSYFLPTKMDMRLSTSLSMLFDFMKGNPNAKPKQPLRPERWIPQEHRDDQTRVTWLGHSAMIVEVNGSILLLDPMLGSAPSPFPFMGGKRYSKQLPFDIQELPEIDAVLFSHDHYDHLDYGTMMRIKDKVRRFIVPLGVKAHLVRWGVDADIISEHDWWDNLEYEGLSLTCAPARHFSGRSLGDRDASLWCSWVIDSGTSRIFFSGDSGYGPHFEEIGNRCGPFDLTLMECGQYDERWAPIHMMPEQTVQAHLDVQGKLMLPIHWGAFTLAFHDWTDPVERAVAAAEKQGVSIVTPRIGEAVQLGSRQLPRTKWWRAV
ncbi:MBL fold metallo-hydrolase [Paenibacillus hexagrammi]|uniref:MBL fold metallo-hydrolase n=1 Tax=Paenibacillus hexagrammi TaxID=2908839 RepID=A0ABY3SED3_9BACL|nr:MBL fold metallo-hydrolase [Paenibacillus sp. YPD9-1]UJF32358.1 MBL fold metallo-hydrolase [Paenibacillus sp. YPD9-1]